MDRANDFIDVKDTLRALTTLWYTGAELATSSPKRGTDAKTNENEIEVRKWLDGKGATSSPR